MIHEKIRQNYEFSPGVDQLKKSWNISNLLKTDCRKLFTENERELSQTEVWLKRHSTQIGAYVVC
jgi:hypothetical protein